MVNDTLTEILVGLVGVIIVIGLGYLIVHNSIEEKKNCEAQNKTMWISYNDTECGCKWYNLCDNGCMICKAGEQNYSATD